MSKSNGFNSMFGITFEDFDSVKKKLDVLTKQINNETSKGIKLNVDTAQITKTIGDLSKLSKQNIQILPNGEIVALSKFNQELGKTITLKQNLSKGTTSVNIGNDIEKSYTKLFDQAIKQQNEIDKMHSSMNEKNRVNAELEAKESNRIIEEKYRQEQEFINTSQKLKQKSSQQSRINAEIEAKISNKLLEEQYKQNEAQKQELSDAQKLVTYEKQKLELRLKGIQLNRKDLVSEPYSNKISNSINNLSGNSTQEVKDKVKQLNIELQKLDQNARMKGLQVGNKSIMSFGESIKSTATKLGIFVSTAMVLNEVQRTIRNATSYIIELDSAMVNLRKVTNETNDTYSKFLNNMHNVALQLGTQSNLMVDATTNWAKTGKNLQDASKLAENTILMTKVGDIPDVNEAQQYMIAPLKAFNIEAEKSITLIDKYNNISNNMATNVKAVGEGLNIASNSLSVARNSLEESIALISTAESTTKAGGSVVGNALKTISLRLATFKDDETGELIPTLADDLKKLGVEAVDSAGQIRSTFDILRDLGKIYKDLDTNTQLKLSEQIGGKRQANIVASILMNVDELDRAFNLASNSAGSAMAEFEKYQEGVQYSIDQLKEQINGLYTSFVNGGFFKGLIDGSANAISAIKSINDTFGTMPTVIATIVGAMTIFNAKFRESTQTIMNFSPSLNKVFNSLNGLSNKFKTSINDYKLQIEHLKSLTSQYQSAGMNSLNFGKSLASLNVKLALTTAKMIATKVATFALQTALSMGLTFVVSTLIGKFSEFVDKLIVTKSELQDLNKDAITTMGGNNELISSVEELIKKEDELKNKLDNKGNTYDEQKRYRQELLDVQKEIANILPESANGFDEEGNKIASNTEKVLENLDAKKKLSESQAIKSIDENSDYETTIKAPKEYEKAKQQLEEMRKAYQNNEKYMGDEVDSKWLQKIESKVKEYEDAIKIMSASIDSLRSAGWDENRIAQEIFKDMPLDEAIGKYNQLTSAVSSYNRALVETDISQKQQSNGSNLGTQSAEVVRLEKLYKSLGYSIEDAKKKINELNGMSMEDSNAQVLEDSTKAYSDAVAKAKELNDVIQDINTTQRMTPDIINRVATLYPEVASRIGDVASTQQFLNEKIGEQETIARNAYQNMLMNDTTYYNEKVKNTDAWQKYLVDVMNNLSSLNADYYNANADGMKNELSNAKSLSQARATIESHTVKAISGLWAEYYKKASGWYTDAPVYQYANKSLTKEAEAILNQERAMKERFKDMANQFASIDSSVFIPSVGADFSTTKDIEKANKETQKQVEDLKDLRDRYYEVTNALQQVNNELRENETTMKNSSDEEKIKYLDKEIQLLNKKKTALEGVRRERQKELQELRDSLSSKGFGFNGDGTIGNSNGRIEALRGWANSLSGDDKENAKKSVEDIADAVKKYTDLLLKDIPDVTNEIKDLTNATIDSQKEIADILKKQRETAIDNMKKETDALKKEIEKRRKLQNDQWKDDDYQDELKKKQNALVDLNAQLQDAMRMADGELVANIKKQIESAQNEINDFIKGNERDKSNERYDEELNKIDEDLQNRIDEIANKLSDEQILVLVQNGVRDLDNVLNQVNKSASNITNTFASIGTIINTDWINSLDVFENKLNAINGTRLDVNAIAKNNRNANGNNGGIKIEMPLTIQGNLTEDILPEVQEMIEDACDNVVKKVANIMDWRG
jgi:TP901 family phage tail tape measure protein